MATEEDIKQFFDEDEWNAMSSEEKAQMAKLSFDIDVFASIKSEDCITTTDGINVEITESNTCDESQENNIDIYCENCQVMYEDYCVNCSMLSRILDANVDYEISDRARKTVPKSIFEIQPSSVEGDGIFALKDIPQGVILGPFDGLDTKNSSSGCCFNVKDSRNFNSDKGQYTNWMGYINYSRDTLKQNLTAFQFNGDLYFRCKRHINIGEELLIFYPNNFIDDAEKYYDPVEEELNSVYACISCCLGFSSHKSLLQHQRKCPSNTEKDGDIEEKIVYCATCEMNLYNREILNGHITSCKTRLERRTKLFGNPLLKPKKFRCLHCPYRTDNEEKYKTHVHTIHEVGVVKSSPDKRKYICNVCDRTFNLRSTRNRHKRIHLEMQFQCNLCKKKFRSKTSLRLHLMIHVGETRFSCDLCNYKCVYKQGLDVHVKAMHGTGAKKYKCSECSFETHYRSGLKKHLISVHSDERKYKCSTCGNVYKSNDTLKKHTVVHTQGKYLLCSQCDKRFSRNGDLKNHIFYCHTEKPFQCDYCNYNSAIKEACDRHMKISHPNGRVHKEFKCSKCKYQSDVRGNYNKHVLLHNSFRPFECDICGKGFTLNNILKKHLLSAHMDKKDFECYTCGKKLKGKSELRAHMRVHTGDKQFKCSQCDFKCNTPISMYRHTQREHNN